MTIGGRLSLAGAGLCALGVLLALPPLVQDPRLLDSLRALALGRPSPPPGSTVLAGIGLAALGNLLLIVGCFIYVLQPVFDPSLRPRVPAGTLRNALAMVVVVFATANVITLPVLAISPRAGTAPGELGPEHVALAIVLSELPILTLLWLRVVWTGEMTWSALGLRRIDLGRCLRAAFSTALALVLSTVVVAAGLSRAGIRQDQVDRFRGIESGPLPIFLMAVAAGCIVAPLVEELFFRGFLFQSFSRRYGRLLGYVLSAGMFAVVHANVSAVIPMFLLGVLLALVYERTQSLYPGMIAHGLNNALAFAALYFKLTA